MTDVTYSHLEEVLCSLGFSPCVIEESNKVYRHKETGALVILPELPLHDPVLPRHLVAVRSILQAYGIADAMDFAM